MIFGLRRKNAVVKIHKRFYRSFADGIIMYMIRLLPFSETTPCTRVDDRFFTSFMPLAPEGFVKVYLYALMLSQRGSQDFDIAGALGMTDAAVSEALIYWQGRGLIRLLPGDTPAVEFLQPGVNAAQSAVSGNYAPFFASLQAVFGSRILSAGELAKVKDWIEVYGLSEAAVLMLTRHCVMNNERGTAVSLNYIDSAARGWADQGVKSAADAEEYLSAYETKKSGASAVIKRFNKKRAPTQDEVTLYESWLQDGFTNESILLACSQLTVYGTPSFKALDAVLQGCKSRGVSTKEAMEEYLRSQEQESAFADMFLKRLGLRRAAGRQDKELLYVWRNEWHIPDELILYAADCSQGASQRMLDCRKRLEKWHTQGVNSMEKARAAFESERREGAETPSAKKNPALRYMQRNSPVDASQFFLSLDDEE